jgi:hypothetical protein
VGGQHPRTTTGLRPRRSVPATQQREQLGWRRQSGTN